MSSIEHTSPDSSRELREQFLIWVMANRDVDAWRWEEVIEPELHKQLDRLIALVVQEARIDELRKVQAISKPNILPKGSTSLEATKQGINFGRRQLNKTIDKRIATLTNNKKGNPEHENAQQDPL